MIEKMKVLTLGRMTDLLFSLVISGYIITLKIDQKIELDRPWQKLRRAKIVQRSASIDCSSMCIYR